MEELTIEDQCAEMRTEIQGLKQQVVDAQGHSSFCDDDVQLPSPNIPASRQGNMKANLTLVFRHLEDARMRLGKVMQAHQGGVSILDK